MLTVKSILTGALVLGAATLPAGVVVTDLATDSVPEAPEVIVAGAPVLVPAGVRFEEPLVSVVLLPPAPVPVAGIEEPRAEAPELALEHALLVRVSLAPPGGVTLDRS
jgi:hypothetical protein